MKIGEVAGKAGIAPSAIRFYEKIGLLPRASRQGGQRQFNEELQLHLAVIDVARRAGFTIAEIKLLFRGFREDIPASLRWRRLAQKKLDELDLQLAHLRQMQALLKKSLRCRCVRLKDCGRIVLSRSKNH